MAEELPMENLLSLEEFREVLRYNPWHFWGLYSATKPGLGINSACNDIVPQYAYQMSGIAGREDIREAIISAEQKFYQFAEYYPALHYGNMVIDFPKYLQTGIERIGYSNANGRWIAVELPEGYVDGLGFETRVEIDDEAAVVYSDEDGDGVDETFTITAPTTITNENFIEVFHTENERMGEGLLDKYRIRPIRVSISGGTVTIIGKKWLCVKPNKYEGFRKEQEMKIDMDDIDNFATDLAIYAHYLDTTGDTTTNAMVKLIWESPPYPSCCSSVTGDTDPAAEGYAIARGVIRNGEAGLIGIGEAIYSATAGAFVAYPWATTFDRCRAPDRLEIRYRAGFPMQSNNQRIAPTIKNMLARFVMAELNQPICACRESNKELWRWQYDMAMSSGNASEAYAYISPEDLRGCPFGTRRGHIEAYRFLKNERRPSGFAI